MGFKTIQVTDKNFKKLFHLKRVFGEKGQVISFNSVISKLIKCFKGK